VTSTPDLRRKVRQLDNDVRAIYGLLETIQTTQGSHGLRLDSIDARLARHDARFDAIDARLNDHDARFDAIDSRFEPIDSKLDTVLDLLRGRTPSVDET
jgi:hypothetical protein